MNTSSVYSSARSNLSRLSNLNGFNVGSPARSNTSRTTSQYDAAAELLMNKYMEGGRMNAAQAANRVVSNLNRLAKTQEQRLKIRRAVEKVKTKVKSARAATGRAARVPNKGIRRGLFGMMQRVQQFRAGNVSNGSGGPSKQSYSKFNRVKRDIISETERTKAAWNGYFKRQHETLKTQSTEITKRLNAKKVNDIQKAWKATFANHERKASLAAKAGRWGKKRNAIVY